MAFLSNASHTQQQSAIKIMTLIEGYLNALMASLKNRLTNDLQATLKAFSLFEPRYVSMLADDDIVSAWDALEVSFSHLTDVATAKSEYAGFKGVLFGCYRNKILRLLLSLQLSYTCNSISVSVSYWRSACALLFHQ